MCFTSGDAAPSSTRSDIRRHIHEHVALFVMLRDTRTRIGHMAPGVEFLLWLGFVGLGPARKILTTLTSALCLKVQTQGLSLTSEASTKLSNSQRLRSRNSTRTQMKPAKPLLQVPLSPLSRARPRTTRTAFRPQADVAVGIVRVRSVLGLREECG